MYKPYPNTETNYNLTTADIVFCYPTNLDRPDSMIVANVNIIYYFMNHIAQRLLFRLKLAFYKQIK